MVAVFATLLALAMPAQATKDVRVLVTVVDQTGAAIRTAKAPTTPAAPVDTNDKGIATITGPGPGKASIQAEFPGFETKLLKDVAIKAGENKHVIVLPIQ